MARSIAILCLGRHPIPPGTIYAGRPGPLGNPYPIGPDGTREEVMAKFAAYFHERLRLDPKFREYLQSIREVPALSCHCAPLACHAQIIARYLERLP